ncbi:phosphoadenosine phosphosulfate reductase family protein [Flavobacterium sp. TP390]|uniref:Phosphoadenosine phosphosulfate reductase family protein n=1 Tax=Flavobacterium profundi TaxID=1774945 RepID=A0A6I4IJ47_9FLAO|nr:phosphoadenosine phosphosulfate reductase family protein [Flavobacterium profundi]MVO09770.1 phosphoadenosine phosphosulfate reductase family protein [Flavobacterium profundi]
MKIIAPFSGGKDSQATLLYAVEKYGLENVIAVFCDTKWEHDITYAHVKYVIEKLGVTFFNLQSKVYNGMVDLAIKKKRFPASKSKFCTTELKVIPMIDFVLEQKENLIILQGIRSDESESRSKMNEECRYFKYYFEPYQTNSMIIENLSKKDKLSLAQKNKLEKAIKRLAKGKEDEKYHTYRKEEVFEWCKNYTDDILRPFFNASANEVITYSLNRGYKINPLYFKGFSRVGCFPCIMCTQKEIDLIIKDFPDIVKKVNEAENKAKSTFFKPDRVPKRYRNQITDNGVKYTSFQDVVNYRKDKNATGDLFENDLELNTCKSIYMICE